MKDIMRLAFMEQRLYIPEDSLATAANDPVLPVSPNGSMPQWIASIGDSYWDWMLKIRFFSGWAMYVNNDGQ
jgi:hypothetical protein